MTVIRGAEDRPLERLDKPVRENLEAERRREMRLVAQHNCFYCHEPLSYPAVYWASAFDLLLHPGCARQLATRLLWDAEEAEGEG